MFPTTSLPDLVPEAQFIQQARTYAERHVTKCRSVLAAKGKVCAATQKLIIENEFVRVIDDQIAVSVTEPLHRHRHGVVILLTTSTYETVTQDGKKTVTEHKEGTALWSEATVHTVKNSGNALAHAIRIELKY